MNRQILQTSLLVISILFFPAFLYAEASPKSIAGFSIGEPIDKYNQPMFSGHLQEKNIYLDNGFRKATLSYGSCKYENEILKIKVKYADKSEIFFKDLFAELTQKYGKYDSWKGDSFQVLSIWKWHFTDDNGNMVSLSLEYNKKDIELSMGSVVKLSYPAKIEEDRQCFNEKNNHNLKDDGEISTSQDWDDLLPQ